MPNAPLLQKMSCHGVCAGTWAVHQSMGSGSRNALMASPQPTVCQGQCRMCLTGQGQGQKHSPAITQQSQPALKAAGATIRAALAASSGREGHFRRYSTVVQWGLKTGKKRDLAASVASWPAGPCLKAVCGPPPERSMQSKATMGHGDSPYWAVLLYQEQDPSMDPD